MADVTGVSIHTLRYYERAGLIDSVDRNAGNQRRYSEADVEWVKFLRRLRESDMPIAEIKRYADLRARGTLTTAARMSLLEEHRLRLSEQIARLRSHEKAIAQKIVDYRANLTEHDGGEHHDG